MVQSKSNATSFILKCLRESIIWLTRFLEDEEVNWKLLFTRLTGVFEDEEEDDDDEEEDDEDEEEEVDEDEGELDDSVYKVNCGTDEEDIRDECRRGVFEKVNDWVDAEVSELEEEGETFDAVGDVM